MKKILLSVAVIAAVAAVVVGVTTAFFSDTETSTGNTFTAGSLDLTVDNECHYNGQVCEEPTDIETTWASIDLGAAHKFFWFNDVKPGDSGEDTISLTVKNNPAWACAKVALTMDDDMSCTEPELGQDTCDVSNTSPWDGEMTENMTLAWWPDDCDNKLESGKEFDGQFFMDRQTIDAIFGNENHELYLTLADNDKNFFGELDSAGKPLPLTGGTRYCVGLAWCMGTMNFVLENDGTYTIKCAGDNVNNAPQSDKLEASMEFSVMQHRNNLDYQCYDTFKGFLPPK